MIRVILFIFLLGSICSIQAAFPSISPFLLEENIIAIDGYPDAYNPSIAQYGENYLLIFRLTTGANRRQDNRIGLIVLDQEFNPIGTPQILSQKDGQTVYGGDARIIAVGDKMYLTFSDDPLNMGKAFQWMRSMCVSELKEENGVFWLTPPLSLRHTTKDGLQAAEKNWSPFDWQGQLLLSYYLSPHEVLLPDLDTGESQPLYMSEFSWNWPYGRIRGGTPSILVDGVYMGFFHSSIRNKKLLGKSCLVYFMGAYIFSPEPPFEILKVSQEPIVGSHFYGKDYIRSMQVIFPGGFIHKDPFIYVIYCRNEKEICYAKLDKKQLLQSMKELHD